MIVITNNGLLYFCISKVLFKVQASFNTRTTSTSLSLSYQALFVKVDENIVLSSSFHRCYAVKL